MKLKKIIAVLLAAVMLCGCSNSSQKEKIESTYDGIDWDKIPEAPASDFGYRVFYGEDEEDMDLMAGYTGDGSDFSKSILIYDYYGHDKNVKIPKEIDGLPVTRMGDGYGRGGYRTEPWNWESEWVEVEWDNSVFRDTGVENVFIPEHLNAIESTSFDDCSTLKNISVDPNNGVFFSEDGVLFIDNAVTRGSAYSYKISAYTKLPQNVYQIADSDQTIDLEELDFGEVVEKTVAYGFYYSCYITDKRLEKFLQKINYQLIGNDHPIYYTDQYSKALRVVKFTDGTYGVQDFMANMLPYIPIEESQFKRTSFPYLYKFPEGKSGSYTVKARPWIRAFDEDGSEEVVDGTAFLYDLSGVGTRAFKNAQFLKELKFENGVTVMGHTIFYYRNDPSEIPIGIEKITIPASLVSIGDDRTGIAKEGYYGAFKYLTNLKEYNVDKNNPVFKSVDGALFSKDGRILYSMPCGIGKDYTVPDGVELIATTAFANAQNMTITIPASVKYLGINSLESSALENYGNRIRNYAVSIFQDSSDITLNVSSKTTIRDVFESLPELCEARYTCSNLTVNFVD